MNFKWVLLLVATSVLSAADVKTPPWEKSPPIAGRDLFRENCAVCHDIDKDQKHTRKLGPSLNHLFKNEKLPLSHAKLNRPYVVVRIKFGGVLMPAFRNQLSDPEIDTLIDYVASK
jgi:mono/diheme cytochrome c family protein